jgi:hypothetical protein
MSRRSISSGIWMKSQCGSTSAAGTTRSGFWACLRGLREAVNVCETDRKGFILNGNDFSKFRRAIFRIKDKHRPDWWPLTAVR